MPSDSLTRQDSVSSTLLLESSNSLPIPNLSSPFDPTIKQATLRFGSSSDTSSFDPPSTPGSPSAFISGYFTVGNTGQVSIDYLFDGGGYRGELGIFSLDGLEQFNPSSSAFTQEVVRRVLSNSLLGHLVIDDQTEAARFTDSFSWEGNFNAGEYLGLKTVTMRPEDRFGVVLLPNGSFRKALAASNFDGSQRPLFSLATANPDGAFQFGQIADVTGSGSTFAMEDLRLDTGSDKDYNDIIFQVVGAVGSAVLLDQVIGLTHDWRPTNLGQKIVSQTGFYVTPGKVLPGDATYPALPTPTIPLTTTDQGGNSLLSPTRIQASTTQDVIDQVSSTDLIDVYQVKSSDLFRSEISVLSGNLSLSFLTTSGQWLGSQVLTPGTHFLQIPSNLPADALIKIDSYSNSTATYILKGFESQAEEPFNINLEFTAGLTTVQQAVIQAAAKSVELIVAQGVPSAIVDGKIIDDINFKISLNNLDGLGGTAAQTKIDFMRYGTLLPAQAITQFDRADIAELERNGQLFSVVQHELLHGLGFGNLWEAKGLVDYAGTPLARYNGANAVQAFKELGGLTDDIALETEGDGSAGLHWNEALFQDEVMTYNLGFKKEADGSIGSPISTVTLASLADLGYQVNLNRATSDFGLFGSQGFDANDLTPEQLAAFQALAATSFGNPDEEFIYATMPEVDPDQVAPEIWAHAERFWKNGEYYDWERYQIRSGDTLSGIAYRTLGHGTYDYYKWIGDHNGIPNYNYIATGNWIEIPRWHPNYERKQEQERLRREEEFRRQQEEEARRRQEQEAQFLRDEEKRKQDEAARLREAEAHQRELEEQQRRLEEEQRRRRQQEEYEKEQARLRELERQAEIARQQGLGGLDWYIATPLSFGNSDPFEIKLEDVVGKLVPDDYYRFTLSRTGRLTAELKQLLADADLVLYDARNRPIAYSMREGITDEQIITDLIPGTYMLRVNNPKGVTTDYELIVRFQHILSATQKGPPPGWKVGGGSNGSSGGGSRGSRGGGIPRGATFADPRIEKIFKKALADFAAPERQKAKSKVDALKFERDRLETEKRDLIASKSAELRSKVHGMLDQVKSEQQENVNGIANSIKGGINGVANGAIGLINGLVPDWVFNLPFGVGGWMRDRFNQAKGAIEGAINGARNWLNAKVDEVRNTINGAISWFIEQSKNLYFTAGEANLAIEGIAAQFRGMIENATAALNASIGTFKGMVLGQIEWTRNIGVPGWNLYDNAIVGLVNNLTNGVQDKVRDTGRFFMDRVGDAERGVQWVIAEIGNLLGDETGRIYNQYQDQILSLNSQIEGITNETDRRIRAKETEYKNQIQGFLNQLGDEGKKILDTLLNFGNSPAGQVGMAVLEVVLGMIPGVGQGLDIKDTAVALYGIFVEGKQDIWEFVGLIGALAGWVPGVGDAIKSVAKIAKNGVDALATFLGKLGPDVTKAAIKAIDSTNWGSILKNLISDLGKKWDNFTHSADNAADWIINALGLKPAWANANNAMFTFRNGADNVAEELTPTQRHFRETLEDAKKKSDSAIGEIFRKHNSIEAARNAALQEVGDLGIDKRKYVGKFGPAKDKVTGFESADGKRGFRIDFDPDDPEKGLHYNWWDWTMGKRESGGRSGAEVIEGGTEKQFMQILEQLNS